MVCGAMLYPDEIFSDTRRVPGFDRERFEGAIGSRIRDWVLFSAGGAGLILAGMLLLRAAYLMLEEGDRFLYVALNNHLQHDAIVPERGIIYDRNQQPLAFNVPGFILYAEGEDVLPRVASVLSIPFYEVEGKTTLTRFVYDWSAITELTRMFEGDNRVQLQPTPIRSYAEGEAISHVVGYMGKPTSVTYWLREGRAGVEHAYESVLKGSAGIRIIETTSQGERISEGVFQKQENGKSVILSLSLDLQRAVHETLSRIAAERGFKGGAAVMLDANNGEVISMVSVPSFDVRLFTEEGRRDGVEALLQNPTSPLFNRAISGLYPPGSSVKPFLAIAALLEGVIDAERSVFTEGKLVVPNPYDPDRPSVFHDWRNHGWVTMRRAIAVSSNVYFYTIGGGFEDIAGLGIKRIRSYLARFGIGRKAGVDIAGEADGVLPDEAWKKEHYPEDPVWRVGDTYNISIGQGGTLVTPLQMAVATLALVNGGDVIEPRLARGVVDDKGLFTPFNNEAPVLQHNAFSPHALAVVKEGMRLAVEEGTAQAVAGLPITVAAKTGTAEFGPRDRVHSWFIGFAPYENPEVVLAVLLENGPAGNPIGAPAAAREILEWYSIHGLRAIHIDKKDSGA